MNDYLETISQKVTVSKSDKTILDTTGQIINEGHDGQTMDKIKLFTDIENNLISGQTSPIITASVVIIPKITKTVKAEFTPGDYYGRYIEVDLARQTLFAYDNNQLVKQFLISSGTATHPTITGTFYVYSKSRVTEMKGEGYDLPGVQWVSWWHGDYSIHGTYWHHNFGHPMSHGCINASDDDAKWVYNWDSVGTPVWVHK